MISTDVPSHMFGARLLALIAFLAGAKNSRRRIQEILREVHGIRASLGAISEAEARASDPQRGRSPQPKLPRIFALREDSGK